MFKCIHISICCVTWLQGLTSTATKKGGLSSGDVGAIYKYKNTLIDVKFDTQSNVCFLVLTSLISISHLQCIIIFIITLNTADCYNINIHWACALNKDYCFIQTPWFYIWQGTMTTFIICLSFLDFILGFDFWLSFFPHSLRFSTSITMLL